MSYSCNLKTFSVNFFTKYLNYHFSGMGREGGACMIDSSTLSGRSIFQQVNLFYLLCLVLVANNSRLKSKSYYVWFLSEWIFCLTKT